ncbi:MAG: hypothetical protein J6X85_06830 [Ruminococcus sp.]|nr:hypothetical protein [Ruminococcus sp.]
MKKVKLIGAFMAAVLAAAPLTGFAGNVLSFNDNAIAIDEVGYPATSYAKGGTAVKITNKTTVLKCGKWSLIADTKGEIYIENTNTGKKKFLKIKDQNGNVMDYHCPYDMFSIYPGKGDRIFKNAYYMEYTLYFQEDGNFVSYANGKLSTPIWHTYTYQPSNNVSFQYELTTSGALQIRRTFTKGQNKGKSDIIWNSDRNYIYRLV